MTSTDHGPLVGMAVLCQAVQRREDGTMDVLGIAEGVVLEPPPPSDDDPLGLRPVAVLPLRLLVSLRAGATRGPCRIDIVGRYPAGNAGPSTAVEVEFTADRPGATVNVPVELRVHEPGVYQFDVLAAGRLVTTVPLTVIYRAASVM